MVELTPILPTELLQYITLSYFEDYKLFELYHIRQFNTCMEACEATALMIAEAHTQVELSYYKVVWNGQEIGYTVTFDKCLYSFAINIRFRQAVILREWMEAVKNIFNNYFYCSLYSNNIRAISFMKRHGLIVAEENKEHNFVTLINEYSCQS